jgi:hypothetical protein
MDIHMVEGMTTGTLTKRKAMTIPMGRHLPLPSHSRRRTRIAMVIPTIMTTTMTMTMDTGIPPTHTIMATRTIQVMNTAMHLHLQLPWPMGILMQRTMNIRMEVILVMWMIITLTTMGIRMITMITRMAKAMLIMDTRMIQTMATPMTQTMVTPTIQVMDIRTMTIATDTKQTMVILTIVIMDTRRLHTRIPMGPKTYRQHLQPAVRVLANAISQALP